VSWNSPLPIRDGGIPIPPLITLVEISKGELELTPPEWNSGIPIPPNIRLV